VRGFSVPVLTGHVPSNAYYGSAQIYRPTYAPLALQRGDEIHRLCGGAFVVTKAGAVHEIIDTYLADKGAFEKTYCYDANFKAPARALTSIPKAQARAVASYRVAK
jgi:hypothetical protein